MDQYDQFRHRLRELFDSQKLAVLSTHRGGQPYASLVAFLATTDLRYIFFITPKTTRKFTNLTADHRVAILINSSSNQVSDFHRAISVTAVGRAEEVGGSERERILDQYLQKHPHLEDFGRSPTCALVRISVKTYYMVQNFQNVMEMQVIP
jgi:nitroimidazol reductase NimA-like FMN-containing flavoprotein (pyridoxamine 5'-phosphate oxidase superfamily)